MPGGRRELRVSQEWSSVSHTILSSRSCLRPGLSISLLLSFLLIATRLISGKCSFDLQKQLVSQAQRSGLVPIVPFFPAHGLNLATPPPANIPCAFLPQHLCPCQKLSPCISMKACKPPTHTQIPSQMLLLHVACSPTLLFLKEFL